MTTELTRYEPPDQVAVADPTGGRLVAWAQAMSAAHKLGSALCETTFVPAQFKNKPDEAAAAIMYGDEIGFTPGQSLQNVYVISGKPALYARAMVALVLSHGHQIWTEASSTQRVVVCGQRRGSTHVERVEWTQNKAQQAGYTTNKKYSTNPEAMLYARASSDVARRIAPDALAGIAYSVEELELEEATSTATDAAPATPRRRTAKRAASTPPPQPDEPDLDEPPPADVGDDSQEETSGTEGGAGSSPAGTPSPASLVTDQQMKKMHATFNDLGVTDRDQRLIITSTAIGRTVGSANELTKDQAATLIDRLDQITRLDDQDKPLVLADMAGQNGETN
ncbi:MAG: hypothetical protein ACRDQA_07545 [Nocardioidaceae bacterium]